MWRHISSILKRYVRHSRQGKWERGPGSRDMPSYQHGRTDAVEFDVVFVRRAAQVRQVRSVRLPSRNT